MLSIYQQNAAIHAKLLGTWWSTMITDWILDAFGGDMHRNQPEFPHHVRWTGEQRIWPMVRQRMARCCSAQTSTEKRTTKRNLRQPIVVQIFANASAIKIPRLYLSTTSNNIYQIQSAILSEICLICLICLGFNWTTSTLASVVEGTLRPQCARCTNPGDRGKRRLPSPGQMLKSLAEEILIGWMKLCETHGFLMLPAILATNPGNCGLGFSSCVFPSSW